MRFIYLDTSAALRIFKEEKETAALKAWLSTHGSAITLTCDLSRTEIRRALHANSGTSDALQEAESWIDESAIIRMTPALFDRAGQVQPGTRLRSLDALHCAAALGLGRALIAFVAYDKRLVDSAWLLGLPVESPT